MQPHPLIKTPCDPCIATLQTSHHLRIPPATQMTSTTATLTHECITALTNLSIAELSDGPVAVVCTV